MKFTAKRESLKFPIAIIDFMMYNNTVWIGVKIEKNKGKRKGN
jgi:hypothetical protein